VREAVQAAVQQQAPRVVGHMVADAVPGGAVLLQRQQLRAGALPFSEALTHKLLRLRICSPLQICEQCNAVKNRSM
jgi:hypothetical protein